MSIARMKPTRTELIFRGSPFTTVAHSIPLPSVADDSMDLHTRVLRNRKIPTTKMAPPPEVSYLVTVDPI
ncbi:hypothetical protein BKA82DRAFT_24984 [Pisolithus tinctorius]|nr:hypothetical protein BKA82DRAFT_24984 [Pisolithus tinctorius]